ncbi:hypothetical protein GQ457_02G009950 [Hibiscus cannabinus]
MQAAQSESKNNVVQVDFATAPMIVSLCCQLPFLFKTARDIDVIQVNQELGFSREESIPTRRERRETGEKGKVAAMKMKASEICVIVIAFSMEGLQNIETVKRRKGL